jgi:hypothetical protein
MAPLPCSIPLMIAGATQSHRIGGCKLLEHQGKGPLILRIHLTIPVASKLPNPESRLMPGGAEAQLVVRQRQFQE